MKTYLVTGGAVIKTCEKMRKRIIEEASKALKCPSENLDILMLLKPLQ